MILLFAVCLAFSGMTLLALAMKRHQPQILDRKLPEPRARLARWSGWGCLAVSRVCVLQVWPTGLALFMAIGLFAFAGLPLVFLLPYQQRLAWRLAMALPIASGALALVSA